MYKMHILVSNLLTYLYNLNFSNLFKFFFQGSGRSCILQNTATVAKASLAEQQCVDKTVLLASDLYLTCRLKNQYLYQKEKLK